MLYIAIYTETQNQSLALTRSDMGKVGFKGSYLKSELLFPQDAGERGDHESEDKSPTENEEDPPGKLHSTSPAEG